jgi:hypothetical protein
MVGLRRRGSHPVHDRIGIPTPTMATTSWSRPADQAVQHGQAGSIPRPIRLRVDRKLQDENLRPLAAVHASGAVQAALLGRSMARLLA